MGRLAALALVLEALQAGEQQLAWQLHQCAMVGLQLSQHALVLLVMERNVMALASPCDILGLCTTARLLAQPPHTCDSIVNQGCSCMNIATSEQVIPMGQAECRSRDNALWVLHITVSMAPTLGTQPLLRQVLHAQVLKWVAQRAQGAATVSAKAGAVCAQVLEWIAQHVRGAASAPATSALGRFESEPAWRMAVSKRRAAAVPATTFLQDLQAALTDAHVRQPACLDEPR